jgi:hypothetical protein
MIYLFDSELGGCGIVFNPSFLSEEEIAFAVKVERIPEPEIIEGKEAVLRCNHKTKRVWYEYVDIQPEVQQFTDNE